MLKRKPRRPGRVSRVLGGRGEATKRREVLEVFERDRDHVHIGGWAAKSLFRMLRRTLPLKANEWTHPAAPNLAEIVAVRFSPSLPPRGFVTQIVSQRSKSRPSQRFDGAASSARWRAKES